MSAPGTVIPQWLRRRAVALLLALTAFVRFGSALQAEEPPAPSNDGMLAHGDFTVLDGEGVPLGWVRSGAGQVQVIEEGGARFVRFTSQRAETDTHLERTVHLDPTWGRLRLGARVRVESIIPGDAAWQVFRLFVVFQDDHGRPVGNDPWSKVLFMLGEVSPGWVEHAREFRIPLAASRAQVVVGFSRSSGVADLGPVSVDPITGERAVGALNPVIGTKPGEHDDRELIARHADDVHATTPDALAYLDAQGGLAYTPDEDGNRLADFSHAGYMGGGISIPTVPPTVTLEADIENPDSDRTADIQRALDQIAARPLDASGFRGALLLRKGRYVVTDTLRIPGSGIVVRGEGPGFGGTWILHRETPVEEGGYFSTISKAKGTIPTLQLTASGAVVTRLSTRIPAHALVPVGETVIPVEDVSGLRVGMDVIIAVAHSQKWLEAMHCPPGWDDRTIRPRMRRFITAVDPVDKTVTLDRPVSTRIDRKNGYCDYARVLTVVSDSRPYNVGVEDILFLSGFDRQEVGPGGYYNDENHPNFVFDAGGVTDAWMRRCVAFFYSASIMGMDRAARITIEDCAMLDGVALDTPAHHEGSRKYSFHVSNSDDVLIQRCYARYGRHAFVGSLTAEGAVFRDCYSERDMLALEWHQRWGHGHIYDHVMTSSWISFRGNSAAIHGQQAAFALAWNCLVKNESGHGPAIWLNRVPGVFNNYAAGCILPDDGTYAYGFDGWGGRHFGERGHVEFDGAFMPVRSLSLAQLRERLGDEAVANVATRAQIDGKPGAVWLDLVAKYARLPIWLDPYQAPWPGLEEWVVAFDPIQASTTRSAPAFTRGQAGTGERGMVYLDDFCDLDANGLPQGWTASGPGTIDAIEEDGIRFVRFRSDRTEAATHLERTLRIDPTWAQVRLGTRARVTELERGAQGWHAFRMLVIFLDDDDRPVGERPFANILFMTGSPAPEWTEHHAEFTIPRGATRIRLLAGLSFCSGVADLGPVRVLFGH